MPETLAQLTLGEHIITVPGRYGNAEATFSVIEEPACKGEHFGGCATCTKKAVCEACGVEYGELDTDKPQNIDGKSDEKGKVPESPKTGDTIQYVFMALLTVSCSLTAALLLYRKNETE